MSRDANQRRPIDYVLAVLAVSVVTAALRPLAGHVNSTTVALALLLVVLFSATLWGSGPAVLAAALAVLSLNYFFLPPFHTLIVEDPQNWVTLMAFLATALTAGQLSARARRRAEEAETGRREIERLYQELRDAFERASHAEALRRSERLKSALLDALTHDIRTPLTSIKASVTTLLNEGGGQAAGPPRLDEESRREMLEVIDEESDRLNRFVEGLVELARLEAGELQLRRRWGAVDEIVETALVRAGTLTRRHRVEVETVGELPLVRVDPRAVSEVVYTLVDNATKYSPAGTRIRVAARHGGGEMVSLSVEDEGEGVAPDLRGRVFEKFFRATRDGDAAGRQPTGMGLGLSIARGIVEAHGGRIWIEDGDSGAGTRFVFTLPIGDDEQ